jgi:hypothetical protein
MSVAHLPPIADRIVSHTILLESTCPSHGIAGTVSGTCLFYITDRGVSPTMESCSRGQQQDL